MKNFFSNENIELYSQERIKEFDKKIDFPNVSSKDFNKAGAHFFAKKAKS